MDSRVSSFLRSLTRERHLLALTRLESRLKALFSPFDWFVVRVFATCMVVGAGVLLTTASHWLGVEVPLRGGTHVEAVVGSPRFINPLLAVSDTDQDLTALVFSGLMKERADGSIVPNLAERYEVSNDGVVYTFYLASKAEFHDGTRVTADDVVFTIKLAQNPAIKSPKRANWEGVEVTKIDDSTITFTLKNPYAPFINNTTLGILPMNYWEDMKPEEFAFSDLNINAVGTGPYKIAKVVRDQSGIPTEIHLIAFTRAITVPYISRFVVRFYQDLNEVRSAFTSGVVDAVYGITPDKASSASFREASYARIFGVFMNQSENALFADQAVRRALNRAIDKQEMIRTILGGYGAPLEGPLPPEGAVRVTPTVSNHIEDARALLIQDGWRLATSTATSTNTGPAVFVKKEKKIETRLSFTLVTANAPELKQAAEYVAQSWRVLGAEVRLEFFDEGDLVTTIIRPRTYDALLFGEVTGREPDLYAFWHSSQRNDPGLNIALYTNSTVDTLLEKARVTNDPTARNATIAEAAHIIADETGALFLYAPYFTYVTEPALRGITLLQVVTPSDRFLEVTDWFLETERVWPIFAHI